VSFFVVSIDCITQFHAVAILLKTASVLPKTKAAAGIYLARARAKLKPAQASRLGPRLHRRKSIHSARSVVGISQVRLQRGARALAQTSAVMTRLVNVTSRVRAAHSVATALIGGCARNIAPGTISIVPESFREARPADESG
jgi:hypothetical protein